MKKDEYLAFEIIITIIFILLMSFGLVLSAIDLIKNGPASYGGLVFGAIALLIILGLILQLIKKRNPKSKARSFLGSLAEDIFEGIINLLSFAG